MRYYLRLLRHLSRRVLLQKYFTEDFEKVTSGTEKCGSNFVATLNFLVDTLRPYDSFSWVNGLMYFFVISGFLIDMTRKKSRAFVLSLGFLMVSITCFNIYGNTFGSNNYGVVCLNIRLVV